MRDAGNGNNKKKNKIKNKRTTITDDTLIDMQLLHNTGKKSCLPEIATVYIPD
ncbi:hypothetical protein CE91St56_30490 [Lachnospiraceae bacterium]|nr:hypothetical protein CE91St56_30490 [Lachnospiraceae bacterium]GKH41995.1 hypothetical protein CE91St57_29690 [Lachnospiraceae bacterium]